MARQPMLISIVVPSYNQAAFLEETLLSLISQDHPDKEILVLDGGSTDGSVEIIRRHAHHLAYWCSEPDGGQAQAIANGMKRARGDLIGWLNSDDVMLPGALSRVAAAAQHRGSACAVFLGGHRVIDEQGRAMELVPAFADSAWCQARLGPVVCQPGTLFGRQAYESVGGLDTSLHYGMDLDLWLRFATAGVPFCRVAGYLASFRRHSQQKGHNLEWLRHCDREETLIRDRYLLPALGSASHRRARTVRRVLSLLSGALVVTLAYRIATRRTLREYHPSYS